MPDMVVLDVVVFRVGGFVHPMMGVLHHERSSCTTFGTLSEGVVGVVVERELGLGSFRSVGIGGYVRVVGFCTSSRCGCSRFGDSFVLHGLISTGLGVT